MKSRIVVYAIILCIQVLISTHETPEPRPGINPNLQKYVDEFVAYGKLYRGPDFKLDIINVDIGPAKDLWDPFIDKGTVGWCKPFLWPQQIMLDTLYWEDATELEKEQLIFHELGHCVLGREHNDKEDENGDPISIMHPYTMDDHTYKRHREQYIKDLFTKE